MPLVQYSDLVESKSKIFHQECTICFDPLEQLSIRRILSCEHLFHDQCLNTWLQEREICPNCKISLDKQALLENEATIPSLKAAILQYSGNPVGQVVS